LDKPSRHEPIHGRRSAGAPAGAAPRSMPWPCRTVTRPHNVAHGSERTLRSGTPDPIGARSANGGPGQRRAGVDVSVTVSNGHRRHAEPPGPGRPHPLHGDLHGGARHRHRRRHRQLDRRQLAWGGNASQARGPGHRASTRRRDQLHAWAYRIRTSMCGENIHHFEKKQRFGFAHAGADHCASQENNLLCGAGLLAVRTRLRRAVHPAGQVLWHIGVRIFSGGSVAYCDTAASFAQYEMQSHAAT
jgi:hypothetical protein